MSDLVRIFDAAAAVGIRWQKLCRIEELKQQASAMRRQCGSCHHWMKSRDCPKEVLMPNGHRSGPHMNHYTCAKFVMCASSESIAREKELEIAQIMAELGTPRGETP